jgi:hypothetical protein
MLQKIEDAIIVTCCLFSIAMCAVIIFYVIAQVFDVGSKGVTLP